MPVRVLSVAESATSRAALPRRGHGTSAPSSPRRDRPTPDWPRDAEAMLLDREKKVPEAKAAYEKAASAGSTSFWTQLSARDHDPLQGRGPQALESSDRVERASVLKSRPRGARLRSSPIFAATSTSTTRPSRPRRRPSSSDPADVGSRHHSARCLAHLSQRDEKRWPWRARHGDGAHRRGPQGRPEKTLVSAFSIVK